MKTEKCLEPPKYPSPGLLQPESLERLEIIQNLELNRKLNRRIE
jgi:hypothetical protein